MAAAITTSGTTLERQILEVFQAANTLEAALPDEDNQGRFSIALDPESGEVTLTATLACTISYAGGVMTLTPAEYV